MKNFILPPSGFTLEERKSELAQKLPKLRRLLEQEGQDGVVLARHPNFSWVTAGGKNFVANCFDVGAATVLVTKDAQYIFTSVIEAPRLIDEELVQELGFQVLIHGWEQDETYAKICAIADPKKLVSDVPMGKIRVDNNFIQPLRILLTPEEITRYHYLGTTMSYAMEKYMLEDVKPGMTEFEIVGGACKALWPFEIEQVMHTIAVDGRRLRYNHALPHGDRFTDCMMMSINGRYKGLITTVSRMLHVGPMKPDIAKWYDTCLHIEAETLGVLTIGQDDFGAYKVLRAGYEKAGHPNAFDAHNQGGCQGYFPREYQITPNRHQATQAGQVYCFNPTIDGIKTEDAMIVTEQGLSFITHPVVFDTITVEAAGRTWDRPAMMAI